MAKKNDRHSIRPSLNGRPRQPQNGQVLDDLGCNLPGDLFHKEMNYPELQNMFTKQDRVLLWSLCFCGEARVTDDQTPASTEPVVPLTLMASTGASAAAQTRRSDAKCIASATRDSPRLRAHLHQAHPAWEGVNSNEETAI